MTTNDNEILQMILKRREELTEDSRLEKIEEPLLDKLSAKIVLIMDDLTEEEMFWQSFYFNNVSLIQERTGSALPNYVTWGQLKCVLYRVEENQQFESCMEYNELLKHAENIGLYDDERDSVMDDEYGIEARDEVMEEGSPCDECDDFKNLYRNKGL